MDVNFHWQIGSKPIITVATQFPKEPCVIGVFGASGAGKSSFLRCLAGLESGLTCYQGDTAKTLRDHGKRVGIVFQSMQLFPHLNVADNLRFAQQHAKSVSSDPGSALLNYEELLDWFAIRHLLSQSVDTLSGGEVQRVAMARALLNQPDVLLLDEALTGLDKRLRRRILKVIAQLPERGISVVMVSHDIRELTLVSDQIWQIDNGLLGLQVEADKLSYALAKQFDKETFLHQPELLFCTLKVATAEASKDQQQEQTGSANDTCLNMRTFTLGKTQLHSTDYLTASGSTRILIPADKLIIARERLSAVSLLNRLEVRINGIEQMPRENCLVTLEFNLAGQVRMLPSIQSNTVVQNLAVQIGDTFQAYF
ncbi:ATP-binding cassette domain-containing protein [Alteromonas flava]|uniref:ATP-binding cassette domain-containing protein n=1 Tax=Alteromonas flava TaxID=2048003 RepID=UPI000C28BC9B|nr:ATP-binding cassette domain-containing protein [Alteromonas flava]